MQLILNTDSDIGFERNMSVIKRNEAITLEEKFTDNAISNTGESVTETVQKEEDKDNSEGCKDNGDISDERSTENIVEETEKHTQEQSSGVGEKILQNVDKGPHENCSIPEDTEVKGELDENDTNSKDLENGNNIIVQNDLTASNAQEILEINENDADREKTCEEMAPENEEDVKHDIDTTDINSNEDNENYSSIKITNVDGHNTQCVVDESTTKITKRKAENEFTMRVKNVSEINENLFDLNNFQSENKTALLEKNKKDSMIEDEHNSLESYTQDNTLEENLNEELELNKGYSSIDNEEVISIDDEKDEENISTIDINVRDNAKESGSELNLEDKLAASSERSKTDDEKNDQATENMEIVENQENLIQENDNVPNGQTAEQRPLPGKNIKDKKPLLHINKLSNTLDILSDEEEDISTQESQSKTSDKQCIKIEDDDDIMLLDEEAKETDKTGCTSTSDNYDKAQNITEQTDQDTNKDISMDITENDKDSNDSKVENFNAAETDISNENQDVVQQVKPNENNSSKPLLPVNFLTSCKKNLADMTREELEEFCVLKIIESVVDRSNLTEMNLQLKTLAHSLEDSKKKIAILMKQNRDLQVVLKSVQEEQKKNSGNAISPLKITRSVGMQVLMIETPNRKKPSSSHKHPNILPVNSVKAQKGACPKPHKFQNIPVPRLVPAANNTDTNNKSTTPCPIAPKNHSPNGLRNSPPSSKPEKRPYCKMQQGNSITVDLTDDEPPSKVVQRNVAPPVRLVPQSLINSQRPPFVNAINNPRKVYIPISGAQNQVGSTIVLKQIAPPAQPRPRAPVIAQKPVAPVRIPRRHPAPLPDCMKQYQPPNWKALPPAPELKLSKVDNGIVISWKIDGYQEDKHEEIASYQLYAYQETSSPPSTALWKKIGDVKALPLPMACTLTQFMSGYKYYFAVRAVDIRSRLGHFSLPGSILLLNKLLD